MTATDEKCKICGSKSRHVFSSTILGRHDISYFLCKKCNFLQTEAPRWQEEAYERSINVSDTGTLARSLHLAQCVAIIIHLFFDRGGKFLDFAGGYGLFVRRMRDIGFDFYWEDKYSPNLIAQGFEASDSDEKFDLITTFESLEHFTEPYTELEQLVRRTDTIIFTTELLPHPIPIPEAWHYYGLHHGQHISFFSVNTFHYLAIEFGTNFYSFGNLHLLTRRKLSEGRLRWALKLKKFGLFQYVVRRTRSLTVADCLHLQNMGTVQPRDLTP